MLTRLLPDQISRLWDIIKYAVEQSLPPIVNEHPDKMNRILASALNGTITVWASYNKSENENNFEGIVLTRFLYDDASGSKSLLIYCLYGYNSVDESSWIHGLQTIAKYAKAKGCSRIVAYTQEPYIVKVVDYLGGSADYTFISFNIDKIV